jgi:hypothetical protein
MDTLLAERVPACLALETARQDPFQPVRHRPKSLTGGQNIALPLTALRLKGRLYPVGLTRVLKRVLHNGADSYQGRSSPGTRSLR